MTKPYQVKDWEAHFEGSKSKHYNNKTSCQMPTKHGLGYRKLIRHKNGAALFGAWCALIQVLSKQPKPRQGYCTDTGSADGRPYNATDLELLTDIPASVFDVLLQVATSHDVAWLLPLQGYHEGSARVVQGGIDLDSDSDSDLDSDIHSTSSSKVDDGFDVFWSSYPKKIGKAAARKAWRKAKGKPRLGELLESINAQKKTEQWQKDNGQFIPHPATWLNQGRWDDSTTTEIEKTKHFED